VLFLCCSSFFLRNVFFKLVSFQESCYPFFIRPEDRALLESNPSAAAGDDGGAGLIKRLIKVGARVSYQA
jgi:hypothetical protein